MFNTNIYKRDKRLETYVINRKLYRYIRKYCVHKLNRQDILIPTKYKYQKYKMLSQEYSYIQLG